MERTSALPATGTGKRVLHVCDTIAGGTGTYLSELLTLQVSQYGAGNVILLLPREHEHYLEPKLRDAGVTLEYFRRPGRYRGLAYLFGRYSEVRRKYEPDVVHAQSTGAGLVTRLHSRPARGVLVYCAHGWTFEMSKRPAMRKLFAVLERALARRADHIIAISQYEYDRGVEIGIDADRISAIRNGITRLPPRVSPADWADDRLKLLFVGRFDRQKGLDVLLEAAAPLTERVCIRAVGDRIVDHRAPPVAQRPGVAFLGWMTGEEVAAQMLSADLLVVPSRWEGFGLVAVEAMRCKLPVAGSAVGGLNEILDSGRYGFIFPSDNVLALRRFLNEVTPEQLSDYRERAYVHFISNYTVERLAMEIDALYARLLAGTGAQRR
jgi:glycosyltransferase involved in cell wall biosynthesis